MKRRGACVAGFLALAVMLCGCNAQQPAKITPTVAATPTAAPRAGETPVPVPTAATPDMPLLKSAYRDRFERAIQNIPMPEAIPQPDGEERYGARFLIEHRDFFVAWTRDIADAMEDAHAAGTDAVSEQINIMLGEDAQVESEFGWVSEFDWRYFSMLYFPYLLADDMRSGNAALLQACQIDVTADYNMQKNIFYFDAEVTWKPFGDLMQQLYTDGADFMPQMLSYAYLNTVYDADGAVCEYVLPPVGGNLNNLANPLPGAQLRDTWYADRDGGDRRHTGMDIRADRGTQILSCTDGTVLYKGEFGGAGYYVMVLDDYGYQYHYYHMMEESDMVEQGQRVSAGDAIGKVGSTGNSSANHLHLTIISPDGVYINAYPYLAA